MKAITLKSRIIVLLTIFTIIVIGIFITVQLAHELKMVNKYNENQAQIVSLALGNTWDRIAGLNVSRDRKIDLFQTKIYSLKKAKSITKAYIFNNLGRVVFSTEGLMPEARGDYDDFNIMNKLDKGETIRGETVVDEQQKLFSIYIPLREADASPFILRVFFSLGDIWAAFNQVYNPALTMGILLVLVSIVLGFLLARLVIGPIRVFNEAAKTVASGRLDLRVDVPTGDELEELSDTFNYMTKELIKMKERAENANPLTKLPGNVMIQEEAERRIKVGEKFTVIYCDLDNFKAFNDKYGIHKGDDAIKLTGKIFREAVEAKGGADDFVGHEGGDDFLLVTKPERTEAITQYITSEFDKRVRAFYDKEDLQQGYIVAHARDGAVKEFPIMTISLAGVSNQFRHIESYAEITNIAAEIKKVAKKKEGSCFVLDKRKD
ncbi:MAG: diguanylate cyclase [Candidatus Omnitrophota bacterium]|nr:MAG: diguanylate cyclase [Candidatus Omnitrophota bacterium]